MWSTDTHTHFENDSRKVTNNNSLSEIRQFNSWTYTPYTDVDFEFSKKE